MITREQDIGGATVRRRFSRWETQGEGEDAKPVRVDGAPGDNLTREQLLAMPTSNRQSLIDNNFIAVYPPAPVEERIAPLHVVSKGFGKFDVIQGHKLNDEPLTKEQAEAMVPGSGEQN